MSFKFLLEILKFSLYLSQKFLHVPQEKNDAY